MLYNVFNRTWWKENPPWPNGLEPEAGLSRKAEFEEAPAKYRREVSK